MAVKIHNPAKLDLSFYRNDHVDFNIAILDETGGGIDLATKYDEATLQVKVSSQAASSVLQITHDGDPATTGKLTLEDGYIRVQAPIAVLDIQPLNYVYDIEFRNSIDGSRRTYVYGAWKISNDITRL